MKKTICFFLIVTALTLLGGCTKREVEDRSFPTVLTIESAEMEQQQSEKQHTSAAYIDYGHVKAVILAKEIAEDNQALKEALLFMEERPVFAQNILIFAAGKEVLKKAGETESETGLYLDDMYRNQPEDAEFPSVTLKDMLNYLHNGEPSITLPYLEIHEGQIIPKDSLELSQDARPAMNMPVMRKVDE